MKKNRQGCVMGRERLAFRENERNPFLCCFEEKIMAAKCILDGWRSDTKNGSSVLFVLFCLLL